MITKIYEIFTDVILLLGETCKNIFETLSTPIKNLIDESVELEEWAQAIITWIVDSAIGDATIIDLLFGIGLSTLVMLTGILFVKRLFK